MDTENLHWLATAGAVDLLVRKSRFLGHALPCCCEADASLELQRLRGVHPKATHHVYAWRLRDERRRFITHRFDDDGEPGGTAGRPVLAALEGRGVVNALVVVVRYFGGIKLGAGGLVRAYGEAAAKALDAGQLRPIIPARHVRVRLPFQHLPRFERMVASEGLEVRGRDFGTDVVFDLLMPEDLIEHCTRELMDMTAGMARIDVGDAADGATAGDA